MDETAIVHYITDLSGVDVVTHLGDYYFFYNPDTTIEPDHKFPFITVVTSNNHDTVSDLSREAVYRLNIGLEKETFRSLFGTDNGTEEGRDFAQLDHFMPHPTYGTMYWCSVLNPGTKTLEQAKSLISEAYNKTVETFNKRAAKKEAK